MNEKEFNRAILAQLYAAAQKIWAESMCFSGFTGAFTARQLAKNVSQIKGKKAESPFISEDKGDEIISVSFGTFSCQFPARLVWKYIYKFERLAGVGGDVMRFVVPERPEVVATYEVTVSKDMAGLAQYVAKNDYRAILGGVALDIDAGRVVATDGKRLLCRPLQIVSQSAAVGDCVVIPAKDWQTVCRAAGKGATMTIQTLHNNGDTYYRYMLGDVAGRNIPGRYPNYTSVIPKVNEGARVNLSAKDWAAEKKVIKAYKRNVGARLIIMQHAGIIDFIIVGDTLCKHLHKATFKPEKAAAFDFAVIYKACLFPSLGSFDVFMPCDNWRPLLAVDGSAVVLNTPAALYSDEFDVEPLFNYKGLEGDINVLTEFFKITEKKKDMNKASEKTGAAVVNVCPVEEKAKKEVSAVTETAAKEVRPAAPKKTATAPKAAIQKAAKKTAAKKTAAKKTAAKKTAAKVGVFDFAAVGIKPGDSLQFIGGAVVTVADGGKVAYNGDLYTLTGFCKKFMPEARRCKSGAYRGPVYFTHAGVRLDKLAKGAAAAGSQARANKTAISKAAKVTPAPTVKAVPAKEYNPVSSFVPVVQPVPAPVPVARKSIIGRLRRWAVAAVLLVLVAVGLAAWIQRGTVQDMTPVGVHQPATPAPAAATVTAQNVTNGASTVIICPAEKHRNDGGYPFGTTDLGARAAALISGRQATNKAINK